MSNQSIHVQTAFMLQRSAFLAKFYDITDNSNELVIPRITESEEMEEFN